MYRRAFCFHQLSSSATHFFSTVHRRLAGHNKWSKIKDKKSANDGQKSVLYTRINREIAVAVKVNGSTDPEKNSALAVVLKRAKEQGVPKENIEKALANCIKSTDRTGPRLIYEALAYNSIGIIIECINENSNRALQSVREILSLHDAHLTPVNFMFNHRGCVTVTLDKHEEFPDELFEIACQHGALDIEEVQRQILKTFRIFCKPQQLTELEGAIENDRERFDIQIQSAEIAFVPTNRVPDPLVENDLKEKVRLLVQDLDANEDTLRVWTSLDFAF